MADPVLTHRDSEDHISVSLDDVTLDLSTDQSGALHHNNSMYLAAA